VNAGESDTGGLAASEDAIEASESAASESGTNKRKRTESEDEDGRHTRTERDSVSVNVATEWAQVLQKLTKGKVAVTRRVIAFFSLLPCLMVTELLTNLGFA
jgi:hypothetical protein